MDEFVDRKYFQIFLSLTLTSLNAQFGSHLFLFSWKKDFAVFIVFHH